MCSCVFNFFLFSPFLIIHFINGSIDINLAEFQYVADHLTGTECLELVAALHFHAFDLPKDIIAAERRLPQDVPCLDLLLHWNSAFREGRGETHVEVCHRLNQIGREDLAKWLSKTVFHEISKDLKVPLTVSEKEEEEEEEKEKTVPRQSTIREPSNDKIIDEAAWWQIDSLLEILIVFGLLSLLFGSFFVCFLCVSRTKKCNKDYKKLAASEF